VADLAETAAAFRVEAEADAVELVVESGAEQAEWAVAEWGVVARAAPAEAALRATWNAVRTPSPSRRGSRCDSQSQHKVAGYADAENADPVVSALSPNSFAISVLERLPSLSMSSAESSSRIISSA